ncbi:hypothetical protein NQZ68_031299 [Dissostichus eleginoides]|nr:hypothetical protein NQZ68_031299 [Dissostichus eleginoides]
MEGTCMEMWVGAIKEALYSALFLFPLHTMTHVFVCPRWSRRPIFLSGMPCSRSAGRSRWNLGGSAPETLRCPLVGFHLEASGWLKSYSTRKA